VFRGFMSFRLGSNGMSGHESWSNSGRRGGNRFLRGGIHCGQSKESQDTKKNNPEALHFSCSCLCLFVCDFGN